MADHAAAHAAAQAQSPELGLAQLQEGHGTRDDKPAKSTLRDSVADLEEENARKDQRIKELEEELERARQKRLPKSLDDLVGSIGDHIMSGADDLPINERPEFFSRLGKIIKQVEAMLEEGPPAPATPAG